MGIIATFIIISALYLVIQAGILAYKKWYLMKLPFVYMLEKKNKRRIRKEIKHLQETFHKIHTQN